MKIAVLAESGKHYLPATRMRILSSLLVQLTESDDSIRIYWAGRNPGIGGWKEARAIKMVNPLLFDRGNSYKRWQNAKEVQRLISSFVPEIILVANENLYSEKKENQVVWVHDEADWLQAFRSQEKLIKAWSKASGIVFTQMNQAQKWKRLMPGKAGCIYATCSFYMNAFRPSDWMTRVSWKTRNTHDDDYFFYYGSGLDDEPIMCLLKAFSRFKKRQQSGLRLVLGIRGLSGGTWREKLKTFKYREEVQVEAPKYADLPDWLGSAYCALTTAADAKDWFLLATAQSFTPVITERSDMADELLGKEAPYYTEWNEEELAANLIEVYTQENRRSEKTSAAQQAIAQSTVDEAAKNLRTILRNLCNE